MNRKIVLECIKKAPAAIAADLKKWDADYMTGNPFYMGNRQISPIVKLVSIYTRLLDMPVFSDTEADTMRAIFSDLAGVRMRLAVDREPYC